ncbi:MAG: hypothetical protein ACSLE0_10620 [Chitinophagaceae bacterium]
MADIKKGKPKYIKDDLTGGCSFYSLFFIQFIMPGKELKAIFYSFYLAIFTILYLSTG